MKDCQKLEQFKLRLLTRAYLVYLIAKPLSDDVDVVEDEYDDYNDDGVCGDGRAGAGGFGCTAMTEIEFIFKMIIQMRLYMHLLLPYISPIIRLTRDRTLITLLKPSSSNLF